MSLATRIRALQRKLGEAPVEDRMAFLYGAHHSLCFYCNDGQQVKEHQPCEACPLHKVLAIKQKQEFERLARQVDDALELSDLRFLVGDLSALYCNATCGERLATGQTSCDRCPLGPRLGRDAERPQPVSVPTPHVWFDDSRPFRFAAGRTITDYDPAHLEEAIVDAVLEDPANLDGTDHSQDYRCDP